MSKSKPSFGSRAALRRALLAILMWTNSTATQAEPAFDGQTLLDRLVQTPPATIRYVEVRYSKLLTEPLVVSGRLSYLGPGRFDRVVERPYDETTSIRDGEVVVRRGDQPPMRFSLKRAPALEGLLDTFGALLAGDGALLERSFTSTLSGDESAWRFDLVPRSRAIGQWLRGIVIDGAGTVPRCITLTETDGDRGVMLLGDLADPPLPDPLDPASLESRCTARGRH